MNWINKSITNIHVTYPNILFCPDQTNIVAMTINSWYSSGLLFFAHSPCNVTPSCSSDRIVPVQNVGAESSLDPLARSRFAMDAKSTETVSNWIGALFQLALVQHCPQLRQYLLSIGDIFGTRRFGEVFTDANFLRQRHHHPLQYGRNLDYVHNNVL